MTQSVSMIISSFQMSCSWVVLLGGAAGVRGGVVNVDSAVEGEVSAQGVGSLNRGAV